MKGWSDNPVHHGFSVNFFLDTNILAYLVDNSHQGLRDFVEVVNASPFARLTSSRYVIFEFVGIRKREHYFRIVVSKSNGQEINFSSLIKYKDAFNHPDAPYNEISAEIYSRVNEDLRRIANDFNIDFEYSVLHEGQLKPTIDVCLASKISNHDSLVLVSSVLPNEQDSKHAVLLTNDTAFFNASIHENVAEVLASVSLAPPKVFAVSNFKGLKLIDRNPDNRGDIEKKISQILIDLLLEKLPQLYLGKTFPPEGVNFPKDCISFKLTDGLDLRSNIYITILSRELDFIYTSKKPVVFWSNGEKIENGFIATSDSNNVSCKLVDVNDSGDEIEISSEVVAELRVAGNLVFIHPDSL